MSKFGSLKLNLMKSSPDILMGAGIGLGICSLVSACYATYKLATSDDISKDKECIESIKEDFEKETKTIVNDNSEVEIVTYTEKEYKKDLTKAYAHVALRVVKAYSLPVALATLSTASVLGSNHILTKRYTATASALAMVNGAFNEYRSRVKEELGDDADIKYRYGIKEEEVEIIETDKNGKEKTVKKKIETMTCGYSPYSRVFDAANLNWENDTYLNKCFLCNTQNWANDILRTRGYIFLNEVYEQLGFERTAEGQIAGWTYDVDNPNGDNFVDFGVYDYEGHPRTAAFINGYEENVILDFNVDGNILAML